MEKNDGENQSVNKVRFAKKINWRKFGHAISLPGNELIRDAVCFLQDQANGAEATAHPRDSLQTGLATPETAASCPISSLTAATENSFRTRYQIESGASRALFRDTGGTYALFSNVALSHQHQQ